MRALFAYYGGKNRIASWILGYLPQTAVYTESCVGSGGVIFSKPRCHIEAVNDIDSHIANFYRVLQSPTYYADLKHRLKYTPYGLDEL